MSAGNKTNTLVEANNLPAFNKELGQWMNRILCHDACNGRGLRDLGRQVKAMVNEISTKITISSSIIAIPMDLRLDQTLLC